MSKKEKQRKCPNCEEFKSAHEFHAGNGYCKECAKVYSKAWNSKQRMSEERRKHKHKRACYDENYTAND